MAKQFVQWLKKTVVDAYDPDRVQRINRLAERLFLELKTKQKEFSLQQFANGLETTKGELQEAKEIAFSRLLENVWRDGSVSLAEQKTVEWVERSLGLVAEDALKIRQRYATDQFKSAFAIAMHDGILSENEYTQLDNIAQTVGSSAATFCRDLFLQEGESIVQAMFLNCVSDGTFEASEWNSIVTLSARLGISRTELGQLIAVPAKRFVEHVLADAKSDEHITTGERSQIESLLTTFDLDSQFCDYVRSEMNNAYWRGEIAQGRLPIVSVPPTLELKAGEILHACAQVDLTFVRQLKSGPTQDTHAGLLWLLDSRAIFQSTTKAETFNYRNIIGIRIHQKLVDFQLKGKPVWKFRLRDDAPLFSLIFGKLIGLANQTATRVVEGESTRHIARDVRQRIWLKYGAQCVDCGARDYLEFDHIIPVAKGGSNLDANIQLLCRRCNQKKSDHI